LHSPIFLLGASPVNNVECVYTNEMVGCDTEFRNWPFLVLAVTKSSATVATNQLCGCEAQHRNRSYGDCIIATVAASRVVSVARLSIATVAAVATDHVMVRCSASQPSQPSQPTKSSQLRHPFRNRRNHRNRSTIQTLIYLHLSERKKVFGGKLSFKKMSAEGRLCT
jgi:hypothetical protein